MQDSNLRGARHADHRFRNGCLAGLGQSSLHDNGFVVSCVVEVPGVEPDPSLHRSAARAAMLHLVFGARRARDSNVRRDLGPGPRASADAARRGVEPRFPRPERGVVPAGPTGIGGVSGSRSRARTLAHGSKGRCAAGYTNRESACPHQDSNLDWPRSERGASPSWATGASPPPGPGGAVEPHLGVEPSASRSRDGCSARRARAACSGACGPGESNPDWPGSRPGASAGWARAA